MIKKFFETIISIIAFLLIISFLQGQRTDSDVNTTERIKEYISIYDLNMVIADEKNTEAYRVDYFKNNAKKKYTKITGTVDDVSAEGVLFAMSVNMQLSNKMQVVCAIMDDKTKEKASLLKKGDTFTCDGYLDKYNIIFGFVTYTVVMR